MSLKPTSILCRGHLYLFFGNNIDQWSTGKLLISIESCLFNDWILISWFSIVHSYRQVGFHPQQILDFRPFGPFLHCSTQEFHPNHWLPRYQDTGSEETVAFSSLGDQDPGFQWFWRFKLSINMEYNILTKKWEMYDISWLPRLILCIFYCLSIFLFVPCQLTLATK